MAHTPGPWIPSGFGFQVLSRNGEKVICHIPDRNDLDIQRGDARLISAAPAMLAALEATIAALGTADPDVWTPVAEMARAAIAQAKGEHHDTDD